MYTCWKSAKSASSDETMADSRSPSYMWRDARPGTVVLMPYSGMAAALPLALPLTTLVGSLRLGEPPLSSGASGDSRTMFCDLPPELQSKIFKLAVNHQVQLYGPDENEDLPDLKPTEAVLR